MNAPKDNRKLYPYCIAIAHVFAAFILWAMAKHPAEADKYAAAYDSTLFGIFLLLMVMAGEKGALTLIAARFGITRVEETTTTTKTAPLAAETRESATE